MSKPVLILWTALLLAAFCSVSEARPATDRARRAERRMERRGAIVSYYERWQEPRRSQRTHNDGNDSSRAYPLLTAKPGAPVRVPATQEPKLEPSRQVHAAEESKAEKEAKNHGFDHLPFGLPVSGKPGYVTLPGKHSNLPQIDVRGLAPGTPVEIPDPDLPGGKIQFRVP